MNAGSLPDGVEALVKKRAGPVESDVLAIERRQSRVGGKIDSGVGVMPEAEDE